tara:strand:+ start:384 stop:635 length:252 start_codon:yes stop_codon:yes gene_type:complete
MSPLSAFIIVIIAITIQFSLYALRRLSEPLRVDSNKEKIIKIRSTKSNYWFNAELTNGRLAMMGLSALIINYGLFGWIIPGFF